MRRRGLDVNPMAQIKACLLLVLLAFHLAGLQWVKAGWDGWSLRCGLLAFAYRGEISGTAKLAEPNALRGNRIDFATVVATGNVQTSNLPKVIDLFESKNNSGQFVLQSPNGSIGSDGVQIAGSVRGESNWAPFRCD